MRVAVVDLGTNTTRLLVADVADRRVEEVDRRNAITRLGEGVDSGGRLLDRAMERVFDVVAEYRQAIDELGAERALAVATSAVRDAEQRRASSGRPCASASARRPHHHAATRRRGSRSRARRSSASRAASRCSCSTSAAAAPSSWSAGPARTELPRLDPGRLGAPDRAPPARDPPTADEVEELRRGDPGDRRRRRAGGRAAQRRRTAWPWRARPRRSRRSTSGSIPTTPRACTATALALETCERIARLLAALPEAERAAGDRPAPRTRANDRRRQRSSWSSRCAPSASSRSRSASTTSSTARQLKAAGLSWTLWSTLNACSSLPDVPRCGYTARAGSGQRASVPDRQLGT